MEKQMRLIDNSGSYQYTTTKNKIYTVKLIPGIFEGFPYYEFINDNGQLTACHTYRFEEINQNNRGEK